MSRPIRWILPAAALFLAACVTINVYFPAAQAEQAAREFVNDVIGNGADPGEAPPPGNQGAGMGLRAGPVAVQQMDEPYVFPRVDAADLAFAARSPEVCSPFEQQACFHQGLLVFLDVLRTGLPIIFRGRFPQLQLRNRNHEL